MIIHLDKEQVRQERRRLLSDDVFVIFHDALRQFCREGYTMLAPAEIYLSAKSFVSDVLLLPDILEGIEDEMDDIQDDAANLSSSNCSKYAPEKRRRNGWRVSVPIC